MVIGGGFLSCEVAAAIATHCPGMQLAMVIPGEDVMARAGFTKEICHFYEKQLARVSIGLSPHPRASIDSFQPLPQFSSHLDLTTDVSFPFAASVAHPRQSKAGVNFAKGYRATRLWCVEEEGRFPTLERSPQGSVLKKTLPRKFGPTDPNFTECRGVVLSNMHTGEEVRV